jgi:uncharacterized protein (DUF1330 family)
MIAEASPDVRLLEKKIIANYRGKGFQVHTRPKPGDLPFDLGGYIPDFLMTKPDGKSYLIEVKGSANQMTIERYRDIAEEVTKHSGWHFLIITGEDIEGEDKALSSREQIFQNYQQAKNLLTSGELEAAFLLGWRAFEATLRQQAVQTHLPIENFPTSSLINHLYSQGELSIEQFDEAVKLNTARNLFVHGYQIETLTENANNLLILLDDLLPSWFGKS